MGRPGLHLGRLSAVLALAILAGVVAAPAAAWDESAVVCRFTEGPRAGTLGFAVGGRAGEPCADRDGSRGVVGPAPPTGGIDPRPAPAAIIRPGGPAHGSADLASEALALPRRSPEDAGASIGIILGSGVLIPGVRPRPPTGAAYNGTATLPPTGGSGAPPPAPLPWPADPGPAKANGGSHSTAPLGTRLFAPADYALPKGYGAVAVVAFRSAPATTAERDRYITICEAYVTGLPDAVIATIAAPNRPQMVTLWPRDDLLAPQSVRAPPPGPALRDLCQASVDNYAYVAADNWLSELPTRVRFGGARRGPFLIAWAPPDARGRPNVPILTLDMSDFRRPELARKAFAAWKTEIEDDPDLWASGWSLTRWKLKVEAMATKHGGPIIAAFKLLPID